MSQSNDIKDDTGDENYSSDFPQVDSSDQADLLTNIEVATRDMSPAKGISNGTKEKLAEDSVKVDFQPKIFESPAGEKPPDPLPPPKFKITVEPVIFLAMVAIVSSMITTGNLMIDRICRVSLNYSRETCRNYTGNETVKNEVQLLATDFSMYLNLIQSIPPVFFAFFLGAWSDKHGRKVPLLVPGFGYLLNNISILIMCFYEDLPPEILLIASVFTGITGGMVSFIMGAFSYISDVSTPERRTVRIAIADLALYVALPIGLTGSGFIYQRWGFKPVYGLNIGFIVLNVLYVFFFVEETIHPTPEVRKNVIRDLFDVQNVVNNLRTCFKPRKGNDRACIILLLLSILCFMMPLMGESSISLLYVQRQFNWTQQDLSIYQAFVIIVSCIGMVIIFRFFLKKWKLSDPVLGLISTFGTVVRSVIFSVSFKDWMMYLGSLVTFFQPIGLPSLRSIASKLVDEDEQGKIYAVIASSEAIVPIFSSIIYTRVYSLTMDDFAGAAYLVSAVLMLGPAVSFSFIHYDRKKRERQGEVQALDSSKGDNPEKC